MVGFRALLQVVVVVRCRPHQQLHHDEVQSRQPACTVLQAGPPPWLETCVHPAQLLGAAVAPTPAVPMCYDDDDDDEEKHEALLSITVRCFNSWLARCRAPSCRACSTARCCASRCCSASRSSSAAQHAWCTRRRCKVCQRCNIAHARHRTVPPLQHHSVLVGCHVRCARLAGHVAAPALRGLDLTGGWRGDWLLVSVGCRWNAEKIVGCCYCLRDDVRDWWWWAQQQAIVCAASW